MYLWATYGSILALDANLLKIQTPWHPPLSIEDLFFQLDDATTSTIAGLAPIGDANVLNNDGSNMVLTLYNFSKNHESYKQNEPTFLVKHLCPEAELPPFYLQETKYIKYKVLKFERTRIVKAFSIGWACHVDICTVS
jgi:hypothetical protein